jgi:hypothetical protein
MRTKPTCWCILAVALAGASIAGCEFDSVKPAPITTITQTHLDRAVVVPGDEIGVTGDPYHAFEHDSGTVRGKIRDLYSNTHDYEPISPGAIWVCRSYQCSSGTRGTLIDIGVMVKREPGYFPEGGDYEYMSIPYDSAVDYTAHPNGILPDADDQLHRGTGVGIKRCVSCHEYQGAGEDRLFCR